MKSKYFLLLFCFNCWINLAFSQNQSISIFVMPGYSILDTVSGDLDQDGTKDMLLLLRSNMEDSINDVAERRSLLILLKKSDQQYYMAARNDEVVLCKECGGGWGDPYSIMVIIIGFFSVEHYGGSNWRWTDIVTFKYNPSKRNWFLHKWGKENWHTSVPDSTVSLKIQTPDNFGVVEFRNFKR
jgi:hypothetical protein